MELQESKLARLPGRVWGALTPGEGEDPPLRSVQDRLEAILQADRLEKIILAVAGRHIPRGARVDPVPGHSTRNWRRPCGNAMCTQCPSFQ